MNIKPTLFQTARICSIIVSLLILLTTSAVVAATVNISWDLNHPAPEGYRVFARRGDQFYNFSLPDWEGNAASCTISDLDDQTEYYFVVRAYDGFQEGPDSEEVHYIPPDRTTAPD